MPTTEALLLFVRLPVPGQVKKRLFPCLGAEKACELYASFVEDLIRRFTETERRSVQLAVAGCDFPVELPQEWESLSHFLQVGETLGDRMSNAFRRRFGDGLEEIVLIGSDAPTLPAELVDQAFNALEDKQVVLGPAMDGGYYLVGARAKCPPIFDGIDWGTDRVLAQTIETIRREKLTLHLLPPWYDVDDEASLRFLTTHLEAMRWAGEEPAPHTGSLLQDWTRRQLIEDPRHLNTHSVR